MPRAAAALLLCLAGTALAAPRSRGTLLRAERHDISAPLMLLAAAPAEDDDEEVELGPRPVPHETQAAPPSRPVADLAARDVARGRPPLPRVPGGLPRRRSDRPVGALRLRVRRVPRLPEARRLARRLLRDLQHLCELRRRRVPRDRLLRL